MSLKVPSGEYDRTVIAGNPRSTRYAEIGHEIAAAEAMGLPVEEIETQPTVAAMSSLLDVVLEPRDLLVIWSGDGGASTSAQAMMGREQPVVLRPGGNAADAYNALNRGKDLRQIIHGGRVEDLRPLEITVTTPDKHTTVRRAIVYTAIGASAIASRDLDALKDAAPSRIPRLVREANIVLDSLKHTPWFTVEDVESNAPPRRVTDRTFARGDVIGKLGRTHANLSLPQFEDLSARTGTYPRSVSLMAKLGLGALRGSLRDEAHFKVKSQDGSPLPAHVDGEYYEVPSGSEMAVTLASQSYRTLTTRL